MRGGKRSNIPHQEFTSKCGKLNVRLIMVEESYWARTRAGYGDEFPTVGLSQVRRLRVRTENMWRPDAPCQKSPRVGPETLEMRESQELRIPIYPLRASFS